MKRRDIARKLVKHLETHALTFKEVQQFIWKKINGIPQKEKIDVCRGYWCNNLTQLFNSQSIFCLFFPGDPRNLVILPFQEPLNKKECLINTLVHMLMKEKKINYIYKHLNILELERKLKKKEHFTNIFKKK